MSIHHLLIILEAAKLAVLVCLLAILLGYLLLPVDASPGVLGLVLAGVAMDTASTMIRRRSSKNTGRGAGTRDTG